mmetsp:Transcript_11505/g.22054  ORF Transcript_11505/g.22054 Transcript_11505/m.22054 type:complete len:221 (+) Transcript_11505:82-744(+)
MKGILRSHTRENDGADESRLVFGVLRMLVNLTNNQDTGCKLANPLLPLVFRILTRNIANGKPRSSSAFDAVTLILGIMINCCEQNKESCEILVACKCKGYTTATDFVVELFERNVEDWAANRASCKGTEQLEKDKQALALESQALASYAAMVLGFWARSSECNMSTIRKALNSPDFGKLTLVLKDFIVLQCRANMLTEESLKSLVTIVDFLKKADIQAGK